MSRGRSSKKNNTEINSHKLFLKNLGLYTQIICREFDSQSSTQGQSAIALLAGIKEYKKSKNIFKPMPSINEAEIPFEVPQNWAWCRLGEIIEYSENKNIEATLTSDTLINYVDIESIDNSSFTIRQAKEKKVSELSSRARRVLKKGYILYSLVRPYLNNIAIVNEDKENYIGSTGFAVFSGILVRNEYIKCFLLSDYVKRMFLEHLSGFNSPSITIDQFQNILIPLPPICDQDKILKFLSDFEEKTLNQNNYQYGCKYEEKIYNIHSAQLAIIELSVQLTHQQDLLKQLRQAFLREAMQGKLVAQDAADGNAATLLQQIKAEKEKLVAEKKLKKEKPLPPIKPEEIPFEIPENWVWCRLGEISTLITDGKHGDANNQANSGFYFLSAKDIKMGELVYNEARQITYKDFIETHNRTNLEPGDLCIVNTGATIGKTAITQDNELTRKTTFQKSVAVVKVLKELTNIYYVNFFVINETPNLLKTSRGSAINNLLLGDMRNVLFPLPPLAEQHRIVQKLDELMQLCDSLQASIQASRQQNDMLLQVALKEALSGGAS